MGLLNYDISDIGTVILSLNFDDEGYQEYLDENSLTDSPVNKVNYVKEYCDYDCEFTDSETFHHLGYDTLTLDDIESYFGERMANDVLSDCMDGEEHEFEAQCYFDDDFDLTDPGQLSKAAETYLKTGRYYKDARGFILPDGVCAFTEIEHNQCSKIPGVKGTFHFIELGCIRFLNHSIDISKEPTREQFDTLYRILSTYNGEELYLDLMNHSIGTISKNYDYCVPLRVIRDIEKYFGIKNNIQEKKKGKRIMEKIMLTRDDVKKIVSESVRRILSEMNPEDTYTIDDYDRMMDYRDEDLGTIGDLALNHHPQATPFRAPWNKDDRSLDTGRVLSNDDEAIESEMDWRKKRLGF